VQAPVSHFVTASDGLRLHVEVYGSRAAATTPVVCLPGLTRTAADFQPLATALAESHELPRWVIAIDYRGRGRSEYDHDARNYSLALELTDLLAVLTALGVEPAVFVGTSRGGILAMLLAVARPGAIAGVVFNDIGPVIETRGLARIKSYVGKLPPPQSYEHAADILRGLFEAQFSNLSAADWMGFARRTFKERDGRLLANYDVKLAKTLEGIDLQRPLPPLWKEFEALAHVPVMVIRGANSDVLSAETVSAMAARRLNLEVLEIPNQGHAPFLAEGETIRRILSFLTLCERARP
jgi:pimeloyl-ACP methyl ester carboxylesterase